MMSGRGRTAVLVAGLAMFWTGLGVFFASQLVLAGLPWSVALSFSMPRWYSWGLLAPGVFWTARRVGAGRSLTARVALHVPLGVAWTSLTILLRLAIRPLRGAPMPPSIAEFFIERFYWDLLVYAAIAGVAIARDLDTQARQRESEAHELAVQAADLERRLVEARLQALRAQLHPHFLFNALNTVSALTETDPPQARRLVESLGDLLRASLTHASRPLVTLGDELTFLDDYLAIELTRFEGRLTASVQADDELLDGRVPGFLLQPLVENAIRHGIAPRLSGGHIDVTARQNSSGVVLEVRDNGVGLRPGWDFTRGAGIGLLNVAARLEQLYGRSGLLRIGSNESGGVTVEVEVPR